MRGERRAGELMAAGGMAGELGVGGHGDGVVVAARGRGGCGWTRRFQPSRAGRAPARAVAAGRGAATSSTESISSADGSSGRGVGTAAPASPSAGEIHQGKLGREGGAVSPARRPGSSDDSGQLSRRGGGRVGGEEGENCYIGLGEWVPLSV
jgi:hypothetical protein